MYAPNSCAHEIDSVIGRNPSGGQRIDRWHAMAAGHIREEQVMKHHAIVVLGMLLLGVGSVVAAEPPNPSLEQSSSAAAMPAPAFLKRTGDTEIEVRFARKQNLETHNLGASLSESVPIGIVALPYGLLMALGNPFYIFVPVIALANIPMGQAFLQRQDALLAAMNPQTFGAELADALARRFDDSQAARKPGRIIFAIYYYGLIAKTKKDVPEALSPDKEVCLVLHGILEVERADAARKEYPFDLAWSGRSPLLPPPYCASFVSLSDEQAKLMRQLMQELVQLIAVWTSHTLDKP